MHFCTVTLPPKRRSTHSTTRPWHWRPWRTLCGTMQNAPKKPEPNCPVCWCALRPHRTGDAGHLPHCPNQRSGFSLHPWRLLARPLQQRVQPRSFGAAAAGHHHRGHLLRLVPPQVSVDEITRQAWATVAWALRNIANFGGDPTRVAIGGHSAGAHLAATCLPPAGPKTTACRKTR